MGGMDPIDRMESEKSGFPVAFAAGAGIVLLVALGLVLLTRGARTSGGAPTVQPLPFGTTEKSYAAHIRFQDIQMAQSSNLLNQQFTYVAGTISNDGAQTIRALEGTFEFHDQFNQVDLRETQRLISIGAPVLAAGQHVDFQITLEHLPSDWNRQYPSVRVTGLVLQ
jgi:hypothetical protein